LGCSQKIYFKKLKTLTEQGEGSIPQRVTGSARLTEIANHVRNYLRGLGLKGGSVSLKFWNVIMFESTPS